MVRKQNANLIPNEMRTPSQRRENARKAGKASAEARRKKKTISNILKQWSNLAVSDKSASQLKAMGFGDDDLINVTLVALKLIEKIKKGDLKAMEMYIKLTGQDNETETRIAKTKEETKLLKVEQYKIKSDFGDNREVEDLTGLAEMIKQGKNDK